MVVIEGLNISSSRKSALGSFMCLLRRSRRKDGGPEDGWKGPCMCLSAVTRKK